MEKIFLRPLYHRQKECIGIYYKSDEVINKAIHSIGTSRWSKTKRCWYVPLSKSNYELVRDRVNGIAQIDHTELYRYLIKKNKQPEEALHQQIKNTDTETRITSIHKEVGKANVDTRISSANSHILPQMKQTLKLKSYSESTIRTYIAEMRQLLIILKDIPADDLTPEHLKRYLVYCSEKLKLSENGIHSRINAIKFYYEQVLKRNKFFWDIPRPKRAIQLPNVLSKEEIAQLLRVIENIKHKAMLMLAYSCGLRVSEVIRLRLTDIDENRFLIFVRRAKGKKDRVVTLSPVIIIMLREYRRRYNPVHYLFEGQHEGQQYSIRSLEVIIQKAKEKAGIKKPGSMHMLRHSFATHLLDKGTDVVFIQKLLGHNNIKTTLRYLHITNKDMINILSPIEDIKDLL